MAEPRKASYTLNGNTVEIEQADYGLWIRWEPVGLAQCKSFLRNVTIHMLGEVVDRLRCSGNVTVVSPDKFADAFDPPDPVHGRAGIQAPDKPREKTT